MRAVRNLPPELRRLGPKIPRLVRNVLPRARLLNRPLNCTPIVSGCASAGDSRTHCHGDTSGKLTRKREKRTYQPTDGTSEKERSTALELNIYHYVDN